MDHQARPIPPQKQGYLLRVYMARAGINTGSALAERIGVSPQTVSGWMNDRVAIGPENLASLLSLLVMTEAELGGLTMAAGRVARG